MTYWHQFTHKWKYVEVWFVFAVSHISYYMITDRLQVTYQIAIGYCIVWMQNHFIKQYLLITDQFSSGLFCSAGD